jgi:hypothetical protein
VRQADAYLLRGAVDTAAARLGEAVEVIAQHGSPRNQPPAFSPSAGGPSWL